MSHEHFVPPATVPAKIRSILFATDFSVISGCALRFALTIASSFKSKLFLTHILSSSAFAENAELGVRGVDPHRHHAENCLRVLENSGALEGIEHSVIMERGGLCEVLAKVVERKKIDLIVLGTHGRAGIMKLLLGSKAEEVLRLAACPVLTVGSHLTAPAMPVSFRKILFATDYSAGSLQGLAYAFSFAEVFQAKVILLHVIEPTEVGWSGQLEKIELQERKTLAALLPKESSCSTDVRAQFGWPADVIVSLSQAERVDLIVMGARSTRALKTFAHLPWTVAHQVACRTPCPVLTVRGRREEGQTNYPITHN